MSLKRIISLIMILCMALSVAMAETKTINGGEERNIQINAAGENAVEEGVSPTTGRKLADVTAPEGSAGLAVTGRYFPMMVQVTNANKGINNYRPLYGASADVIYQTSLASNGVDRMTYVFSDVIPPFVGFVRSTRVTHLRLRQEWGAGYITSGWSEADVPGEMDALGIPNPIVRIMKAEDPGYIFCGGAPARPWGKYYRRMIGTGVPAAPNNEVFEAAAIVNEVVPASYTAPNHAFRFTDAKPEGEDATFIYVQLTGSDETYSELEYDEETNKYYRYLYDNGTPVTYMESIPQDLTRTKVDGENRFQVRGLYPGQEITFDNVIVQSVEYTWANEERPIPALVGSGNADYFMGGKHIAGVWQRDDANSRTVFYGADGNEIELQRGRTLIILLDWKNTGSVRYE